MMSYKRGFWCDFVLIIFLNTVIVFLILTVKNMTWGVNLPKSMLYNNFMLMLELLPKFLLRYALA